MIGFYLAFILFRGRVRALVGLITGLERTATELFLLYGTRTSSITIQKNTKSFSMGAPKKKRVEIILLSSVYFMRPVKFAGNEDPIIETGSIIFGSGGRDGMGGMCVCV